MEHRWGKRFAYCYEVRVRTRSGLIGTGTLQDISISGALLESSLPVRLHEAVEIRIPELPRRIALHGYVVRRANEGFAIEWFQLMPELLEWVATRERRAVLRPYVPLRR